MKKIFALLLAVLMVFALCACGKKGEAQDDSLKGLSDAQKAYAGDWYGWWQITDTSEEISELEGQWYDCCASVSFTDGAAAIDLWDENVTRDDCIGHFNLNIAEDGTCTATDGWMNINGTELGDISSVSGLSLSLDGNVLTFSGPYKDSLGAFTYSFTMRPWGDLWEGVDESELPVGYTDWYLPLVNAGAEQAPAEISITG